MIWAPDFVISSEKILEEKLKILQDRSSPLMGSADLDVSSAIMFFCWLNSVY